MAGAEFFSDVREATELGGGKGPAGDAAAEHEGVLGRGDVEKAVELVAEDVVGIRKDVFLRVGEHGGVAVEAILVVLDRFLSAELIDGRAEYGFHGLLGIVGETALAVLPEEGELAALEDAGDEAVEIVFLLGGED